MTGALEALVLCQDLQQPAVRDCLLQNVCQRGVDTLGVALRIGHKDHAVFVLVAKWRLVATGARVHKIIGAVAAAAAK